MTLRLSTKMAPLVGVVCVVILGAAAQGSAQQVVVLTPSILATAQDQGPQDGVFDNYENPAGYARVTNNGWTSLRGELAFSLAEIPSGTTVTAATLSFHIGPWEANEAMPRYVVVHGYGGDGVLALSDFARTGFVGSFVFSSPEWRLVSLDITGLVADVRFGGLGFVEVIVREEPKNGANYVIMSVETASIAVTYTPRPARYIDIDIKPESMPNTINRGSHGAVPVALLSSADFDVATVDVSSLGFGRTGLEPSLAFCSRGFEDVNGDGLPDSVCHFAPSLAGFLFYRHDGGDRGGHSQRHSSQGVGFSAYC